MKSRFFGIILLLWVGAGTLIFLKPHAGERTERSPSSIPESAPLPPDKEILPSEPRKESPPSRSVQPPKEESETQLAQTDFASPKTRQRLHEFADLQQKVLPKDHDRLAKKSLLNNRELLLAAKEVLLKPAANLEDQSLQNQALDYLFEAIKGPNSQAAIIALKEIVADRTVENSQIHIEERKALAEVKAEVLFQLSSERPEETASLQASLPGPVSERIWRNVQTQQENNLAESREIKDQRP